MFAYLLTLVHACPINWVCIPTPTLPQIKETVEQASADLAVGNAQLEQFMIDRPDTRNIIERNHEFRWLCIWQFAGALKGDRARWVNEEPTAGSAADHIPATSEHPILIRVSRAESPIDSCTDLLFELMNREIDEEYNSLSAADPIKRKSRDDFALACVRDEFKVCQQLRWFFRHYPFIGAKEKTAPYYSWIVSFEMGFDRDIYLIKVNDAPDNPLKYYGTAYDFICRDEVKKRKALARFKECYPDWPK